MRVTTNAPLLAATFRKYAELNRRDTARLLLEQGKKLAIELYNQTAAVAPTQSEITSDVLQQGWRIPKFFKDGRWGRGYPEQWLGRVVADLPKKRGRKSKARQALEARILRARPTLQQMQTSVIRFRLTARLYVASGWLPAVLRLGGAVKVTSGDVDPERGRAEIEEREGLTRISIINSTPGILTVDRKYDIAQRAIVARIADMLVYIRRKWRDTP